MEAASVPSGFYNYGNTCFLGASVALLETLSSTAHALALSDSNLAKAFQGLLARTDVRVHLTTILANPGVIQLRGVAEQADPHEFLTFVFSELGGNVMASLELGYHGLKRLKCQNPDCQIEDTYPLPSEYFVHLEMNRSLEEAILAFTSPSEVENLCAACGNTRKTQTME
jgi:uncharacterized UBP type Zn finger protein